MAANMTNWLESEVTDAANGTGTLAVAAALKLRLHTADPTEVGSTAPLGTGGGYDVSGQTVTFADLSTLTCSNNAFTITNCPAGTITHFTVWDGTTNVWFYGTYAKTLVVGRDLEFSGGEFDIVFQGDITEKCAQGIVNAFRNVGAFTNTTPKLAAWTASPGTTGAVGANEAADATYSRQTPSFAAESGGAQATNTDTSFGTWTGAETITHIGMIDENTVPDDVLYFAAPDGGSVVMAAGEILRCKSAEFTLTST